MNYLSKFHNLVLLDVSLLNEEKLIVKHYNLKIGKYSKQIVVTRCCYLLLPQIVVKTKYIK